MACCALGVASGGAGSARASAFELYGFHPRAQAMAGAMTAGDDDYTAVFYNPAALGLGDRVSFGFGLTLTVPDLYVDRAPGLGDSSHPTVLPKPTLGATLGWRYPIGGIFRRKVAVGVGIYLPVARIVRVQGLDPLTPQFYLYQNLSEKLLLVVGASARVARWLTLGAGALVLADLGGHSNLHLDVANGTFRAADFSVELVPTITPTAGAHVHLDGGLDLGLSVRGSSSLTFSLPVTVTEGEAVSLDIGVVQTVLWSPPEVALGMSYRAPDGRLRLSADLTLSLWSLAPDPSPRLSVDIGGALLDGLGLGHAIDVSARTRPVDLAFANTLVPRLGAEWAPLGWLRLRAGYAFRPTPSPRQTGTMAYLDNDAHIVGLGAGVVFGDPLKVHKRPVRLDLSAQATILPRRTVYREEVGDPLGDLSHGGVVWTFSAAVSHEY